MPRLAVRRFTRNDGVRLPNGDEGVISSQFYKNDGSVGCVVRPTGQTELVVVDEAVLVSVPALNAGKYGGPSRGGSPGGWVGGNNYRR